MRTEVARPLSNPRPRRPLVYLGEAAMVVGVALTVLGILGVGGLFNLGLGLALVFVGSIPVILEAAASPFVSEDLDQEIRRFFDDER
jgi:hypothetical protein